MSALAEKLAAVAEHLERLAPTSSGPPRQETSHQIWFDNPDERLNREIRRRSDVLGIIRPQLRDLAPGGQRPRP